VQGIREQHDQFPLIADAAGDMVVGQFGSFVKGFLQKYTEPIEDGDVIFLSDPCAQREPNAQSPDPRARASACLARED